MNDQITYNQIHKLIGEEAYLIYEQLVEDWVRNIHFTQVECIVDLTAILGPGKAKHVLYKAEQHAIQEIERAAQDEKDRFFK